jgi:ubiquinone/menaquinone biosynthesis C-methylase UbiE
MYNNQVRLEELLTAYYRDALGLPNWRRAVEKRLEFGLSWTLRRLMNFIPEQNSNVLDVGCGLGDFLLAARQVAISNQLFGIEPDYAWAVEARRRTDKNSIGVYVSKGESLPFSSDSFDGIFCNQVLEHVEHLESVIMEMVRVCKPGGWLYISGPNYLIPYEPHYRLMFLPWLPKKFSKLILQMVKRNPDYLINCVSYINPFMVTRILRKLGLENEINIMQESLASPTLFASKTAQHISHAINWLPLPSRIVYMLLPTFALVAWKPGNVEQAR